MDKAPSSAPEIIFFDAAGTLIHLPRGVAFHYGQVALRHGLDVPEATWAAAFRAAWKAAPAREATRQPRPEDDAGWWRQIVDHVLDQCSAPAEFPRGPFFQEVYAEFTRPGVWALYPEADEVLRTCAAKCRLGIISNFDGRLRVILELLGVSQLFETVIISSEVGADKPDPWIFEHAAQLAGIPIDTALHVGDDPVLDWQAAAQAGMKSFHLDRPTNSLRDLLTLLP